MSVDDNLRLAAEFLENYNRHDMENSVTFWADEAQGIARRDFQVNYWLAAFPDTHMEVVSMTAQDDRVVTEAIVRATHAGTLEMWVDDPMPATNRKIEFPYCGITQWENGKLTAQRAYVDIATILRQLDLLPDGFKW